jgi:hypothetical protein
MDVLGSAASERKFKQMIARNKRMVGLAPWETMSWTVPTTPTGKQDEERSQYFRRDGILSGSELRECQCVLHVAAQQSESCLSGLPKTAGHMVDNKRCYDPSMACTGSPDKPNLKKCLGTMNFDSVPDNELVAFAAMHGISMTWPYSRRKMIKRLKRARIVLAGKYLPCKKHDILGGKEMFRAIKEEEDDDQFKREPLPQPPPSMIKGEPPTPVPR